MYVYILHSATLQKYYIGISSHPQLRLKQHARGQGAWTSRAKDWILVHTEPAGSPTAARIIERRIKSRGAVRYLLDRAASQSRADAGQG